MAVLKRRLFSKKGLFDKSVLYLYINQSTKKEEEEGEEIFFSFGA